jgi:oxygen-independent coproporphyrinogen-3 oxidase
VVNETLLTRLRTIWGVDLAALILDVETPGSSVIARYRSQGMLEQHERRLVLTRAGRAFADRIASDLFLSDDR